MAEYEFFLTDDSGKKIKLLKDISFATLSRAISGYGTIHVGLPFKSFDVDPAFLPDRRIDVWRSAKNGATPRREGSYFLRKYNVYTRETDHMDIIEFYGRSPIDILRRQSVTSTTLANYSKVDEIDDMMKAIVTDNFITTPQTVPLGEFTVSGSEHLGPSISHSFFGQTVLDILKDLHDMSLTLNKLLSTNRRIFFDVVEGPPLSNGGFSYIFQTFADLRGRDRTKSTIFSVENGNIKDPSYYEDHLDSSTIATVLNLSSSSSNGSSISSDRYLSRWNDIVITQQTSEGTVAINNAQANQILQSHGADKSLNVTFIDSPGSNRQPRSLYGIDWDLGDLLRVNYAGKYFNTEVAIVYLSIDDQGKENIIGMSKVQ